MPEQVPGQTGVSALDEAIRRAIDRHLLEWSLTTVQVMSVLEEIKLDVWHQDYHELEREGNVSDA